MVESWRAAAGRCVSSQGAVNGSEQSNVHVREYRLREGASTAEVAEYELTHLLNPITHQMEHKWTMLLSRFEREVRDDRVGLQGHEARYMHKTRMSII